MTDLLAFSRSPSSAPETKVSWVQPRDWGRVLPVSLSNPLAVCLPFHSRRHKPKPKRIDRLSLCPGASAMIGYSLKGIDAEINKAMTREILDPIVSARLAQGELEYLEVSKEEKNEIIQQWYSNVAEKKKKKKLQSKDKKGKGKE